MAEHIGIKIAEVRKSKGLSQQELANNTNINIRTIQRIESRDCIPQKETLHILSKNLEYDFLPYSKEHTEKNRKNLVLLHLSSLSPILLLILGILIRDKMGLKRNHEPFALHFLGIIGLMIAYGLSLFLLIMRKKTWCTYKLRFVITAILFFGGVLGVAIIENPTKNQELFFYWIQIPLIHSLVDRFFMLLSNKIHGRDILLYIRGSFDLENQSDEKRLRFSDYLFSIILIVLLFAIPLYSIF